MSVKLTQSASSDPPPAELLAVRGEYGRGGIIFCLNGNTTELLFPTMHYSASQPVSQIERFKDPYRRLWVF